MRTHHRKASWHHALILVVAAVTAIAAFPVTSAFADPGRGHHDRGNHYGWRNHARYVAAPPAPLYRPAPVVVRAPFVAPAFIGAHYAAAYGPYMAGQFYFAPHNHAHAVYRFPVMLPTGAMVYQPYVYCGGHMVTGAYVPPARTWASVTVGLPIGNAGYVQLHRDWDDD